MTHALFSIKPEWAALILSGHKIAEARRVTPTRLKPGSVIVWYATSPICAIVGESEVGEIYDAQEHIRAGRWLYPLTIGGCGMRLEQAAEYWRGARSPCAIWLRSTRRYPMIPWVQPGECFYGPPGIPQLWAALGRPTQSFRYLTDAELDAIRREAGEDPDER